MQQANFPSATPFYSPYAVTYGNNVAQQYQPFPASYAQPTATPYYYPQYQCSFNTQPAANPTYASPVSSWPNMMPVSPTPRVGPNVGSCHSPAPMQCQPQPRTLPPTSTMSPHAAVFVPQASAVINNPLSSNPKPKLNTFITYKSHPTPTVPAPQGVNESSSTTTPTESNQATITSTHSTPTEASGGASSSPVETAAQRHMVFFIGLPRTLTESEFVATVIKTTHIIPTEVRIIGTKSGKSTGCAIICTEKPDDAEIVAQNMNGSLVGGLAVLATTRPPTNQEFASILKPKAVVEKYPWEGEIADLVKQYRENCKIECLSPPVKLVFALPLPSDFPFDIDGNKLIVRVELPTSYPNDPCLFHLLNSNIPLKVGRNITDAVVRRAKQAYSGKPVMIQGLLRWMLANLEKLMVDKVITNDFKHGIQVIVPTNKPLAKPPAEFAPKPPPQQSPPPVASDSEEENVESDSESAEEQEAPAPIQGTFSSATAHRGTQLKIPQLILSGIGIMSCVELALVVLCSRCRQQAELRARPSKKVTIECSKCHCEIHVLFRPEPVHESSSVIGYIDNEVCSPLEVHQSSIFSAVCLGCTEEVLFKNKPFGISATEVCRKCFAHLSFTIDRVTFTKIKAAPEAPIVVRKKAPRDPREAAAIKLGSPLPETGTCKHYGHSFRWFRFPCCGRAWPCDQCHDTHSDHVAEWASRVICGFCSSEQTASNTKCSKCSSDFSGKGGSFWEGGKGCRDHSKMSRKDAHKHSGINKTESKKKKSTTTTTTTKKT
ncbi:CHY zinc finger protein [Pelomyxa schiedti]|nr:CHY zinc finger protein [Pelomyxa schiedti]